MIKNFGSSCGCFSCLNKESDKRMFTPINLLRRVLPSLFECNSARFSKRKQACLLVLVTANVSIVSSFIEHKLSSRTITKKSNLNRLFARYYQQFFGTNIMHFALHYSNSWITFSHRYYNTNQSKLMGTYPGVFKQKAIGRHTKLTLLRLSDRNQSRNALEN